MKLTGGDPFWSVRNGLLSTYPALRQNLACDVAIIGGGITGALVAFHMAQAGVSSVLLDKRDIGAGSTSGSTGLLQYEVDVPLRKLVKQTGPQKANRSYLLCQEAVKKLQAIVKKHSLHCEMASRPSLFLACDQREIPEFQEEQLLRKRIGLDVEFWDAKKIETHYPFVRPAALFSENAAQVDPHRLTQGLLKVAERMGLKVFDRTTAAQWSPTRTGIEVITERGHKIAARRLVVAAGFESQKYLPKGIGQLKSTYALISEPIAGLRTWHRRSLIWESATPYLYLRTTGENRIIVGGEDVNIVNPAYRDRMIAAKVRILLHKFRVLFPDINLEVAFSWAGTFSSTKDGLAYIGMHRSLPHVFFALGYGGNGITYSLIAAEILRDQVLGKHNPDAAVFSFNR